MDQRAGPFPSSLNGVTFPPRRQPTSAPGDDYAWPSMSIIIFQHSPTQVGGAGRLATTLRDNGFKLDFRRADLHPADPALGVPADLDNVHGVVILGGPQMVTDIENLPWLAAEAAFVKSAHEAALPVIGICLGAQLIAKALGGVVDWKDKPAMGMQPLSINPLGQTDVLFGGIQWQHPQFFSCSQEIKQLPTGATVLATAAGGASSSPTPIAAFRVGVRTVAFQYHPECDRPQLEALVASSAAGMAKAGLSSGDVMAQVDAHYSTYARVGDRLALNLVTYLFPLTLRKS